MSKIAKEIAAYFNDYVPFQELLDVLVDIDTEEGRVALAEIIDEVLEGKIISKSEVDGLRGENREHYLANCALSGRIAELNGKISDLERRNAQQSTWLTEAWPLSNQVPGLKNKLWDAEQEIHDLKLKLERFQAANEKQYSIIVELEKDLIDEMEENDRVTDGWEALVQSQEKTIEGLETKLKRAENPDVATAAQMWMDALGWKSDYQLFQDASSQSEQEKTEKPAETIEHPSCLKPADALNWTNKKVNESFPDGWNGFVWNWTSTFTK